MFCVSQASTAVCMDQIQPASSSSSTNADPHGGRAIDRHNPIIGDGKRFTRSILPIPTPCTSLQPPPINPTPYHQLQKNKKPFLSSDDSSNKKDHQSQSKSKSKKSSKSNQKVMNETEIKRKSLISSLKKEVSKDYSVSRKSCSEQSGSVLPPGSSRYLLSDTAFLDGVSEFDTVSVDFRKTIDNHQMGVDKDESIKSKSKSKAKPFSSSSSSDNSSSNQVVVLRVSLHCKGCEGKVRKHLSRMQGVTSFNIDFAAKKVTVTGEVTPLGVLASISKVKTAQLWTSTPNPILKK